VYDAAGRLVRVLADGHMSAGDHSLRWAGERGDGGIVPNGLYVARLTFAGRTLTQKLLRVR
jgi:flagellar hook assembly protein FlgD